MKIVLLPSVQHTGSRFMEDLLHRHDIEYRQAHTNESRADFIQNWIDAEAVVAVPLRHPLSVAMSWRSRKQPFEKMFDQWQHLIEWDKHCNAHLVPVDHPQREGYLNDLSLALDCELQTDWAKYGHKPGEADISDLERDQIAELCATPFIATVYNGEVVPHGT